MIVSQILKSKADIGVISVKADASVSEAVGILSEKRIGTVVVSEDGALLVWPSR
jgi:CBS domain-containing protein